MAARAKKAKSKDKPKAKAKPASARSAKLAKAKSTKKSLPTKTKSLSKAKVAKKAAKKPTKKPVIKKAAVKKAKPSKVVRPSKLRASKTRLSKKKLATTRTTSVSHKQTKGNGVRKAPRLSKPVVAKTTSRRPLPAAKPRTSSVLRQILPPAPPPIAKPEPRKTATAAALRAFEQAVRVFNRRQFEEAKSHFELLQQRFPLEVEITHRAQMYIQVCIQKLAQAPAPVVRNASADELYDRGVYALNLGDVAEARSFFEKALRLNPNEPHFLYSLAVTYAKSGAQEEALDYLRRSIQMQPRFRSQAFDDMDFSGLRENRQFQELLGLTSPFDLLR